MPLAAPITVLLVIYPETSCETGQVSVRLSVRSYDVNIFKTLRLRDRWADVQ